MAEELGDYRGLGVGGRVVGIDSGVGDFRGGLVVPCAAGEQRTKEEGTVVKGMSRILGDER